MEQRSIGSLRVSVVGLGCNNIGRSLDADATARLVGAAIDAGVTFFDTADKYGGMRSEEYLGRALGSRRDEVVVATKFGMPLDDDPTHAGASAAWIREAVQGSLRRLGTDRIDLYQLHKPDPAVPLDETLGALNDLVTEGLVREIGVSNATAADLRAGAERADANGWPRYRSVQNELSLLRRGAVDDGLLDAATELGMGFLPFYPLASGLLTGTYRRGAPLPTNTRLATIPMYQDQWTDADRERAMDLTSFAEARGITMLELAFGWLLSHAGVSSVIAGASTPEQLTANASAAGRVPSPDDLIGIEAILAA